MNNSVKDFIGGTHFSCGLQANGDAFAHPHPKDTLNSITSGTLGVKSCDYVTNGYNNFSGEAYRCGSDSLRNNTQQNADVNHSIFANAQGKSR